MIDYNAFTASLAEYLAAAIPSLTVYDYYPDRPDSTPCFAPYSWDIDNLLDMAGRWETAVLTARVLMERSGSPRAAQRALMTYLAKNGPNSVQAAIREANGPGGTALGGVCKNIIVTGQSAGMEYLFGEERYYGASFQIKISG